MQGLNRAYFIGNLGRDPELRTTRGGQSVITLNLATPHGRKQGEEWVDTPDWHRLTAFGKTAESLSRNAHKGDMIALECVVRPGKWTDKDGQVHYEVNLYVERVLWISQKRRGASAAFAPPTIPELGEQGEVAEEVQEAEEVEAGARVPDAGEGAELPPF